MPALAGKRIGILVAEGSDQAELSVIKKVLLNAGAEPTVLTVKKQELKAWLNTEWGAAVRIESNVLDAEADDFDGLVVPGGLAGADTLRADRQAIGLVADMVRRGKPVAAVGHAVWVLIEAEAIQGREVTSCETIRTDVENAGGEWQDEPAVSDGEVITGRNEDDLPEFMAQFVEAVMNPRTWPSSMPQA